MPNDAETGRIRYVWERLYAWMEGVFDDNNYSGYTIGGEDLDINESLIYPAITIGLDEATFVTETYNRSTPSTGIFVYYPFTLYVYHYKSTQPDEDEYYDVDLLADRILKYLRTKQRDSTEMTTHKIVDVLDLTSEPSQPRGVRRLARVIITGMIKTIRLDSP
jgi:hypothetical protein